jgi:DNA gyrase subunit A
MEIARANTCLLVVTDRGYGKQTDIEEYPEHHRGGKGVYTIKMTKQKGDLSAMKIVDEDDQVMVITESGVMVRTPVKGISKLGRATQGVRIMEVEKKDRVTAVAIVGDTSTKTARDLKDDALASDEGDEQLELPEE